MSRGNGSQGSRFSFQSGISSKFHPEFLAQGFPAAKNVCLYFSQRDPKFGSDLFVTQIFKVIKDERDSLSRGQFLQSHFQKAPVIFGFQVLFEGVGRRELDFAIVFLLLERKLREKSPARPVARKMIEA